MVFVSQAFPPARVFAARLAPADGPEATGAECLGRRAQMTSNTARSATPAQIQIFEDRSSAWVSSRRKVTSSRVGLAGKGAGAGPSLMGFTLETGGLLTTGVGL